MLNLFSCACLRAQGQAAQHAVQQQAAMGPPQPQPPPAQAHAAQGGQQRSGALMPFNFLLMPEMASLQDGAWPRHSTLLPWAHSAHVGVQCPVQRVRLQWLVQSHTALACTLVGFRGLLWPASRLCPKESWSIVTLPFVMNGTCTTA